MEPRREPAFLEQFLPFLVFVVTKGGIKELLRRVLQFDSYEVDVRDNGEHEDGRWFISKCNSGAGVCCAVIGRRPCQSDVPRRSAALYWRSASLAPRTAFQTPPESHHPPIVLEAWPLLSL